MVAQGFARRMAASACCGSSGVGVVFVRLVAGQDADELHDEARATRTDAAERLGRS